VVQHLVEKCGADVNDPHNNPHVHQTISNKDAGYQSRTDIPFQRTMQHKCAERLKYRRRKGEDKSVLHWGQRKLLLSEIEFILMFEEQCKLVVYAGAAPGTHIQFLSSLFPKIHFVCFDPANFTVRKTDHITLRQEMFTDTTAREFTNEQGCLFVSDIRAADWQTMGNNEVETQVWQDMEDQMRWHQIIRPVASMLKFRLPWTPGTSRYLAGDIYLPTWGPITTTEARLICLRDAPIVDYDNTAYEEEMFFFNTVQRVGLYNHGVKGEGLDHCYDCTAEIHVLKKFIEKRHASEHQADSESSATNASMASQVRPVTEVKLLPASMSMSALPSPFRTTLAPAPPMSVYSELIKSTPTSRPPEIDINALISDMSYRISRACAKDRTLLDGNLDPEDRKRVIKQRQYIDDQPAYEVANKRARSPEPVQYDERARKLMRVSGYTEGEGLGARNQGSTAPLTMRTQTNSEGLGFAPRDYKPWRDVRPTTQQWHKVCV
jgi:hypothetical protein